MTSDTISHIKENVYYWLLVLYTSYNVQPKSSLSLIITRSIYMIVTHLTLFAIKKCILIDNLHLYSDLFISYILLLTPNTLHKYCHKYHFSNSMIFSKPDMPVVYIMQQIPMENNCADWSVISCSFSCIFTLCHFCLSPFNLQHHPYGSV